MCAASRHNTTKYNYGGPDRSTQAEATTQMQKLNNLETGSVAVKWTLMKTSKGAA